MQKILFDFTLIPIISAVVLGTLRLLLHLRGRFLSIFECLLSVLWICILSCLYFIHGDIRFVVGGWSLRQGVAVFVNMNSMWFIWAFTIVWISVKLRSDFKHIDRTYEAILDFLYSAVYAVYIFGDLFNLYVSVELASILSFLLVGYGEKPIRVWAALKYMMMSVVAFNLYLSGISLIYEATGSLNISYISNSGISLPPIAISLILTGILVKSGIFFLSAWLPDAHAEATTPVSMILSGGIVNLGIFALLRILPFIQQQYPQIIDIVAITGMLSVLLGGIYATFESRPKRLLAYSTFSQMGISVFLVAVAPVAVGLYAFFHSLTKALLFSTVKGKGKSSKVFMYIGIFSLIGLPPFLGFVAKKSLFLFNPILGIVISLLTAIYIFTLPKFVKGKLDSKYRLQLSEFILFLCILLPTFFLRWPGWTYLVEGFIIAIIGYFIAKFIKPLPFPTSIFEIEIGISYQILFAMFVVLALAM